MRELHAIHLGLHHFRHSLRGLTVGVFTGSTTALSYIKKQGDVFRCSQLGSTTPPPVGGIIRFDSGSPIYHWVPECRLVANSLSRHQQVLGSDWTLAQEVVDELVARWPSDIDLFTTALNYRLPVYFSPLNDPMAAGTDAFLQVWDCLQAYTFPPIEIHSLET